MDQKLLDSFVAEVQSLKAQEEKVDELRIAVLTHLQAEGIDKVQTADGTFAVVARIAYEYPPDVDAKKRIWEDAKKNAIANDKVTKTESSSLRFQAV